MSQLNLKICLDRVRQERPLTLVITNQVTIGECANGLLAIGAAPVMSDDPADGASLAAMARATVINIGTVNQSQFEVMMTAGAAARASGTPVIFDPVGAGATKTRRDYSSKIISRLKPEVIRGNFSEIKALAGIAMAQKGVDSIDEGDCTAVATIAEDLAQKLQCLVAVTGATDVVATGNKVFYIEGGSPLLTRLTGTGCLLSALVGAYVGANPNQIASAVVAAMAHMALAGSRAAALVDHANRLGTFRVELFDHLGTISGDDLAQAIVKERP